MTDREFDRRLRDYYRAELSAAGEVPDALLASVGAIPDDIPIERGFAMRRRFVLLAAAALLAALLIGAAVAIGTGIIRLPWLPDEAIVAALSDELLTPSCDQTLPEGVLFRMDYPANYPEDYPEDDPTRELTQLYAYEDGRLLRTGHRHRGGPEVDQTLEGRRLSRAGVQRLIDSIADSGLRDCISVPLEDVARDFNFGSFSISARTRDGVVAAVLGEGFVRAVTPTEQDAAARLVEQFLDPDFGVPRPEWVQDEWQEQPWDRWEVRISRWEGLTTDSEFWLNHPRSKFLIGWDESVLPDGSSFGTFGSPMPDQPMNPGDAVEFVEVRCRVVNADLADAFMTFLGDPVGPDFPPPSGFWDRTGGVGVQVRELLPHEGCRLDETPPELPPGGTFPGLSACDVSRAAFGREPTHSEYESSRSGWARCIDDVDEGGFVFVSRHRVSGAEAARVIEYQFGPGFTTDELAGRTVYINACANSEQPGPECFPAIAVSAEPYLVIVAPYDDTTSPRTLARLVIERLGG